jgi:transcriptional regulator with XRE-family HTH domain
MAGMGYRGKLVEQEEARRLRAGGMTMPDIAARLGVSKGSVSLWTRDVPFAAGPRRPPAARTPNRLQRAKQAEIEALLVAGRERIGPLTDRDLLIAGAALYAGEGAKADGRVKLANSDPRMIDLHLRWLRRFFAVDESRLRVHLYLHEGLDLDRAVDFWSSATRIPPGQFSRPYRAVPDVGIRHNKHEHGCPSIVYSCASTHRAVMGLVAALLGSDDLPG